jgi:integrase
MRAIVSVGPPGNKVGIILDAVGTRAAWRKVKPFKRVDETVVRYLSAAEARRLVRACPEDLKKMVQAALLTGCRYSELARLKCANFNSDSDTLAIRLSGGKIRHVVLTDEAKACFADWTKGRAPSENVFLRADGDVWGASHQKRLWMRRASGRVFRQR